MRSGHKAIKQILQLFCFLVSFFCMILTLQPIFLTGINAHLPSEYVECRTLEMTFGKLVQVPMRAMLKEKWITNLGASLQNKSLFSDLLYDGTCKKIRDFPICQCHSNGEVVSDKQFNAFLGHCQSILLPSTGGIHTICLPNPKQGQRGHHHSDVRRNCTKQGWKCNQRAPTWHTSYR